MLKDKKIRIQRPVTTGTGARKTTTWVDLGNTAVTDPPHYFWAYYRHRSEKELSQSQATVYIADIMFAINWRSDVRAGYRIVYKGINYAIVNVDDYEGRKQDLKLYVKVAVV